MSREDLLRLNEIADKLEELGIDLDEAEAFLDAASSEPAPCAA